MSLETVKSVLAEAMTLEPRDYDNGKLLATLRELRNSAALNGRDFQLSVLDDNVLTENLVSFVDRMFIESRSNADCKLAFSIGVQCVVNLMNDNDSARKFFADNYVQKVVSWLRCEDPKQQNYVAAALLNIDKVGGLDLKDKEFVDTLIKSGESGVEFALHLLQNLVRSHCYVQLYGAAGDDGKLLLLQLLECAANESDDFTEEVKFVCAVYKKSSDNLMARISTINPFMAQELAVILELLVCLSYKPVYMELMQDDLSLVISSAYLLRGIHECISQKKTWKESLEEAVNTITNKNAAVKRKPFFGVKGNLIRLLGNLAYRNRRNQDEIREAGCIPIVLDSCKLDGENPFIKEWSILSIRNLCEGNLENQQFIKDLKLEGCEIAHELSLTLDGEDGTSVNIAPLRRL